MSTPDISYIARRFREGEYYCHDVIVGGLCINIKLTAGASMEKVNKRVKEWLDHPFPEYQSGDTINQIFPDLTATGLPIPSMRSTAVEIQNYLATREIDYKDGETKAVMLARIPK